MRSIRLAAAMIAAAMSVVLATGGPMPAWAIAGGGFAPGGPMSGSMRPSCNGYNMDGTINTAPGADQPGCVDHSARALRPSAPERGPSSR